MLRKSALPTRLSGKEILGSGLANEKGEYAEGAGSIPARGNTEAQWRSAAESPATRNAERAAQMSNRPKCVHCGQPYGRRDTHTVEVKWKAGEPMPEYRGNGVLVKKRTITNMPHGEIEEFNTRYKTAPKRVTWGSDEARGYYEVWDGETWLTAYAPFCTLRCALDYARKAYARASKTALRRVV